MDKQAEPGKAADLDAVIIGAGFAGLGMLWRLREQLGMSAQVYETGEVSRFSCD